MSLESLTISDPECGSTAAILPGFGFNCFRFAAPAAGRLVELLWSDPQLASGGARPSGSGIPLLFPFPGRIRGLKFSWERREYPLEEGDGCGNAIHGFVHRRAWRVIEQHPSSVTGEFQASLDDPPLLDRWPADFRIAARYEVRGRTLLARYTITNPDRRPLPCGLGTHPYFRLPLGDRTAADCRIVAPVGEAWELDQMHATGISVASPLARAISQGLLFADNRLDNVFSATLPAEGPIVARVIGPSSGLAIRQSADRALPYCVLYTPPHREAVCIEPYSCVPDCFRLLRSGIDAGLRILQPGESWEAQVEIALEETPKGGSNP